MRQTKFYVLAFFLMSGVLVSGTTFAQTPQSPNVPVLAIPGSTAASAESAPKQPQQMTKKKASHQVAEEEPEAASEPTPDSGAGPAMTKFRKAQAAYKKAVLAVQDLQKQYLALDASDEEKEAIGEKLEKYAAFLTKLHPQLMELAEKAWLETPSKDPEMLRFIVEVLEVRLVTEDYERAQILLKELLALNIPEVLPDLYDVAGETAFMMNQFEDAGRYFTEASAKEVLSDRCKAFQGDLLYYRTAWAKESVLRQKDASSDLPRVKLETTKGTIVLELYENEAPNTVANFIYLVEKGYYDGLYFDSVIPGFCAESGRSLETEDGGPGYSIRDEFDEKNVRTHYRGTISMSNSGPNTAGSRFFISFSPMRQLDGKFVVFGRIIEGMEVLSELQRIDVANPDPMAEPDQITRATVIRKQDHRYRPKILKIAAPEEENDDPEDAARKTKSKKKTKKAKGSSAY